MKNPLSQDLEHILEHTKNLWEELRGKQIFITGGTGFFGCWFLETFIWVNRKLNLNAKALVLTRDYKRFQKKAPHLAESPEIKFHIGDVRDFVFPEGEFPYIIHAAATSAEATFKGEDELEKLDTVVRGTKHTLDFALHCKAKKFLFTSSGAVYGRQPSYLTHISEDYIGAPLLSELSSVWGEAKRVAEFLCTYYFKKYGIETKIARCFSFVGPYLQLDIHYAIGNFIRDAIKGGPIEIKGDGTPLRSYLYAADLMIWLWTILFKGKPCFPYNVGSEREISIEELANLVAKCTGYPIEIRKAKKPDFNKPPSRYIPSTKRAQKELGLKETITLEEAIRKTFIYYFEKFRLSNNVEAKIKNE